MHARIVATGVAFLTVVSLAVPARAGVPCRLLTDKAGDTGFPHAASLDIVSADVRTDATRLTAVIRVNGSLDALADPDSPTGRRVYLGLLGQHDDGMVAYLAYTVAPGGRYAEFGIRNAAQYIEQRIDAAAFTVSGDEVTMTVRHTAFKKHGNFYPGAKLHGVQVWTTLTAGAQYGGTFAWWFPPQGPADKATTSRTYLAGSKNCVTLGTPLPR